MLSVQTIVQKVKLRDLRFKDKIVVDVAAVRSFR